MNGPLWRLGAVELAGAIRRREVSSREVAESVLARVGACNPKLNALVEVHAEQALAAAAAVDAALARGEDPGPLAGVPVTIKVNVDQVGCATTNGLAALKTLIATEDSPPVANLRRAGAVIIGRTNTPGFSVRWFTDNDAHGRTLNPFDGARTPGGSSGGAGAAVATGMGAIGHGNDYGGSIRYPAYACGVVGLRPTSGRVPAYNASAKEERGVSAQLMSVQGPLTRSVADARVALAAMAQRDARDPLWVPAPLDYPAEPRSLRVAMFARSARYEADPAVVEALEQAARWLSAAGCVVEEAEPPQFGEGADLWAALVYDDMRRSALPLIERVGDAALKTSLALTMHDMVGADRDGYLDLLSRRVGIARAWSRFLDRHDVLLMPVSWRVPFPIDEDTVSVERMRAVLDAQSPLLATAMLGLPGLSVPTGLREGLPTGVQIVAARYREDRCLAAGEIVERAAGFSAIARLA